MRKFNIEIFVASFAVVLAVAFLGSMFTDTGDWYESIKPSITPPNYIFPIAWTILYILIAFSLYFTLLGAKNKRPVIIIFGANLFFNLFWSYLFFVLKNPTLAFTDIVLMWCSIVFMIKVSYKVDKKAAYMLVPYLIWVTYAMLLNFLIIWPIF